MSVVTASNTILASGVNVEYKFIRKENKNKTYKHELHILELDGGVRVRNLKVDVREVINGVFRDVDPVVYGYRVVRKIYLYTKDKEVYEYVNKERDHRNTFILETDASLYDFYLYRKQQELDLTGWVKDVVNSNKGYVHFRGVTTDVLERELLIPDLWLTLQSFDVREKDVYADVYVEILPFDCEVDKIDLKDALDGAITVNLYFDGAKVYDFISKRDYNRSIMPFLEEGGSKLVKGLPEHIENN